MSGKQAMVTMTEGPLLPILVRVAVPITFANLFQASYDIVNAFWLGRLGQEAIAAVTASGPRTERVTGSLTRRARICLTETQWREVYDRTRTGHDDFIRDASGGCMAPTRGGSMCGG